MSKTAKVEKFPELPRMTVPINGYFLSEYPEGLCIFEIFENSISRSSFLIHKIVETQTKENTSL
jgi:hypothetical protein